ncbi:MAG: YwqG family protein [Candidatus Omnitrophota bacterium]
MMDNTSQSSDSKQAKKYRYTSPEYHTLFGHFFWCAVFGAAYYFFDHWLLAVGFGIAVLALLWRLFFGLSKDYDPSEKEYPFKAPADMKKELLDLIAKEVPGPSGEALARLVRPCIRVITKPMLEEDLPVGVSKIGGLPDLPKEVAWPFVKKEKNLCEFVGQFNLADVSPFDEEKLLPAKGMLYFFVDAPEMEAKVLYFNVPAEALARRNVPAKLKVPLYEECALEFRQEYRVPDLASNVEELLKKEKDGAIFADDEDCAEKYSGRVDEICNTGRYSSDHHFFGYSGSIQGDLVIGVDIPEGKKILEMSDAELRSAQKTRLLFQLDSDSNPNMNLGDGGRYYFEIETDDLKNACFDKVSFMVES